MIWNKNVNIITIPLLMGREHICHMKYYMIGSFINTNSLLCCVIGGFINTNSLLCCVIGGFIYSYEDNTTQSRLSFVTFIACEVPHKPREPAVKDAGSQRSVPGTTGLYVWLSVPLFRIQSTIDMLLAIMCDYYLQ